MPRKVNCGIDYDEDYDVFEDYDYDSDVQENSEGPETKQENITLGVWCCSICTFDNEEGMSACNICWVLRTPLGNACSNGNKNTGPLKFDFPSPYDLVLKGLRLSKVGSKAEQYQTLVAASHLTVWPTTSSGQPTTFFSQAVSFLFPYRTEQRLR